MVEIWLMAGLLLMAGLRLTAGLLLMAGLWLMAGLLPIAGLFPTAGLLLMAGLWLMAGLGACRTGLGAIEVTGDRMGGIAGMVKCMDSGLMVCWAGECRAGDAAAAIGDAIGGSE